MAFAAATCLKKTIERLLNYPQYICLVPPSSETIQVVHTEAQSLIQLLEELDETSKGRSRERVNAVDAQIREAVSKFEDELESRVMDQLVSQSDRTANGDAAGTQFSIDLMDLEQDVQSLAERVTELKRVYTSVLEKMNDEEYDDGVVSSVTGFGETKSNMIGLSDQFLKIKAWVLDGSDPDFYPPVSLLGMGGIGKTMLAKKIFNDPDVESHFYHRLWVTVGRKCKSEEILRVLIAQVDPGNDEILAEGEEDMGKYLKKSLKGRRSLIVVDDIWETNDLNGVSNYMSGKKNGSVLLITSRIHGQVAFFPTSLQVRFLNKEESWELLCEKVFGKESCPYSLEKAGKKIAEKCDGLPLTILAIARLLSTAEMTPEYWDEVAEDRNSVFKDAYDEILEVLYPSYNYLPQHLKMCFLYAGVFPPRTVIPQSKLVNMWGVEEFLETPDEDYITELVFNSLFLVYATSSTDFSSYYTRIKTLGVHSSLWHLCNREARQIKSFHVSSSRKHGLSEDMKSQRRFCIHNNVLFAIKDVHNFMEDEHCSSTTRSLGCYGPYHPYQVPITFGLRLLRLLDALAIRLYEFPIQVQKLILLRYLCLTYNGMLPSSISKLWNLQFLIVRQHLRMIKKYQAPSYLPMEIWDLKELKHLQVMGSDLPDPTPVDTLLPNLSTLLDVSGDTCTKGVLERIPNLNKLGLRIELRPDDDELLTCFAHISSCLEDLKTLKCVIVNPVHRTKVAPLRHFSSGIRKLTLSGLYYPWKEMSKIASLPNLQVLKLRNYAFQGPEWHMEECSFGKLRSLSIEDTDLVQWKVSESFSDELSSISLHHCYRLQEINWATDVLPRKIKVVDCNPLILPCWNQILRSGTSHSDTIVEAHSSWVDGELDRGLVINQLSYTWYRGD